MTQEFAPFPGTIRLAWAFTLGLIGCTRPPQPIESTPGPFSSVSTPNPAPTAQVSPEKRSSIGVDDAPGPRQRVSHAVVLLGMPWGESGELRFVPLLCTLGGKLNMGKACGEAMPATAKVRVTRSATQTPAVMTLSRATQDYHDEAGEHDYKAPLGPACCMYNTCVEETIPYLGQAIAGGPSRMLAIWPESADVDLRPRGPGIETGEVADGIANDEKGVRVVQLIRSGDRRLASTAGPCGSCGALWVEPGGGAPGEAGDLKAPTSKRFVQLGGIGIGPDGFDIVATTDVDGDGQAEAIVYEVWRNDYGVHVLGRDWSKPAYRFSCGNI